MGRKGRMARWALGIVVGIVCFVIALMMKHNSADCGGTQMTAGQKCVNLKTMQSKTVGQQESSNNHTKITLLIVGPLVALGSTVFLIAEAKRKPRAGQPAFAAPIPLGRPVGAQPQPSFGQAQPGPGGGPSRASAGRPMARRTTAGSRTARRQTAPEPVSSPTAAGRKVSPTAGNRRVSPTAAARGRPRPDIGSSPTVSPRNTRRRRATRRTAGGRRVSPLTAGRHSARPHSIRWPARTGRRGSRPGR